MADIDYTILQCLLIRILSPAFLKRPLIDGYSYRLFFHRTNVAGQFNTDTKTYSASCVLLVNLYPAIIETLLTVIVTGCSFANTVLPVY